MRTLVILLMLAVSAALAGPLAPGFQPKTARAGGHEQVDSIKVAIEIAETSKGRTAPNACYRIDSLCKAQGWSDSIVTGTDIDSASKLANYNVVVTGDIGYDDNDFNTYEGALKDWVRNGGGFVGLGWIVYGVFDKSAWQMDSIMAVTADSNYGFLTTGQVRIDDSTNPVTQNVHDFNIQGYGEYANAGLQPGATELGDYTYTADSGKASIAVREVGAGRSVYLGPIYFATFSGYANEPYYDDTNAMRLLKQAIEWAATVPTGISRPGSTPALRAELGAAVPNPFARTTTMRLLVPRDQPVEVAVYNGVGQKVRLLASGLRRAGVFNLAWDGTDERGRSVQAGVYIVRAKADGFTATQKLVLDR